jgi:hypothetical protein
VYVCMYVCMYVSTVDQGQARAAGAAPDRATRRGLPPAHGTRLGRLHGALCMYMYVGMWL